MSTKEAPNVNSNVEIPKDAGEREAKVKRLAEIKVALLKLDYTEGTANNELLSQSSALRSDPDKNAVNKDGKTADELLAEFNEKSAATGKKKEALEKEMVSLTKSANSVADYDTLRKASRERAAASQLACQEKPTDLSEFSNQELDKIRSQLQANPLPGGDAASVDDGTGGTGKAEVTAANIKKP